MSVDNEMFSVYESAVKVYQSSDIKELSKDFSAWNDYVETLRKGFSAAVSLDLNNIFPPTIFDASGTEWQIDVSPSEDTVLFNDSGEQTVADMVFRELQIARARDNWNKDDTFEEFSDLDDDEEELDRTAFERAWLNMENDRRREFYEEFIKGKVPPRKKELDVSEASNKLQNDIIERDNSHLELSQSQNAPEAEKPHPASRA